MNLDVISKAKAEEFAQDKLAEAEEAQAKQDAVGVVRALKPLDEILSTINPIFGKVKKIFFAVTEVDERVEGYKHATRKKALKPSETLEDYIRRNLKGKKNPFVKVEKLDSKKLEAAMENDPILKRLVEEEQEYSDTMTFAKGK